MQSNEIELKTSDGEMPAFEARPTGDAKGAVVVIQEAFGITDHIKDVCRRLADAGWVAVAPALYHREGAPVFAAQDLDEAMPYLGKLTQAGLDVDTEATLRWLDGQGFESEHVGVVGFCVGGAVAAHIAATHELGAAVTFYGSGITEPRFGLAPMVDAAPAFKTPWLGLYGDEDTSIPVDQVEALRDASLKARVETEVERFADAGHAFHNDSRAENYNAAAAEEAWKRMLAWFDQHIS